MQGAKIHVSELLTRELSKKKGIAYSEAKKLIQLHWQQIRKSSLYAKVQKEVEHGNSVSTR